LRNKSDILIIGAGVVGCALAREFSKYELKTVLLEKESDVCCGVSKANSGVLHTGLYYKKGSLKARLCVEGRLMYKRLVKELDVPCTLCGKHVVARTEDEIKDLERLRDVGEANGVRGLTIISRELAKKREPNVDSLGALYSPVAGIVSPYLFTIALAENASSNGVNVYLNTKVTGIKQVNEGFRVTTTQGDFTADIVINSAGLYADRIASMVGIDQYRLYPSRGEYLVLDKDSRDLIGGMVYPVPPKVAGYLGIHLTPTIDGNLLIGPSSEFIDVLEDTRTTEERILELMTEAKDLLPNISLKAVIYAFSGVRSKITPPNEKEARDFIIQEDLVDFINLIGIESPGLTSSPAIAKFVVQLVKEKRDIRRKKDFSPIERKTVRFNETSREKQSSLVNEDPAYGEMVCRCEHVTKREVLDALNNPFGVKTIAAVKYRTRAGMGRCHGGFCLPKIVEILEKEYGMAAEEMTLKNTDSPLFIGRTKDLRKKGV